MSKLLSFRLYVTVASGTDLNLKFLLFCLHFTASITCMYLPVYMYIHVHVLIPIISYMYSVPVVFTNCSFYVLCKSQYRISSGLLLSLSSSSYYSVQ